MISYYVMVIVALSLVSEIVNADAPNRHCHKGYHESLGDENFGIQEKFCTKNKDFDCDRICIHHLMGVVHRWGANWKVRDAKAISTAFVRNYFHSTEEGKATALKLATKISAVCLGKLASEIKAKKPCDDWIDFYDCVEDIWKCK